LEIKKERTVMKRIRKLTTAFLVIALLVTSLVSVPAFADEPAGPVERIAGDSRYLTAVEVSKVAYDEGANKVVLASGENFPDALTGSVLAYSLGAPILLAKKDSIDDKTLAEIARLKGDGAMTITILGGEKAIGAEVETTLKKKGYTVKRVEGASRYDTAVDIAEAVIDDDWDGTVFLATGETPWDALAVGPYAASTGTPILLTPSDSLRDVTAEFLLDHKDKVTEVVILGGDKAVSPAVVSELENLGIIPEITRIEGANRELTALAIAFAYADSLSEEEFIAVTGSNFPDAILGAYFGASFAVGDAKALPIVLVRDGVKEEVDGYIRGYAIDENGKLEKDKDGKLVVDEDSDFDKLYIIGGPKAVSDEVEAVLEEALYRLPAEVDAEGNEFYVGHAPGGGAVFTYGFRFEADKVVIVINNVTMKESLHSPGIYTWTEASNKLAIEQNYLNELKAGEYKVKVTLDGFVMEEQTIVVKALPTKATLDMTIDPDKVTKDSDKTIKLSLTGYMPDDDPEADGAFLDNADDAKVVVGGKVLTVSTDYTVTGTDITLQTAFLNTLIVGKHNVSVEIGDYPKATGSFEIVAAEEDAAAETYVSFADDKVKFAMAINDIKDLSFFMYKGVEDVAIDSTKLEISVAGKKLTKYDYEIVKTDEVNTNEIKILKGYLEDLDIASYEIAVTYDKKALNKLTLEITVGAPYTVDSSVVIKDKDAEEIEILEIVPVTIKVVDSLGNPVLGGKTVEVTSNPTTTVALSLNSDMSRATTSPIFVKLDKNGEATLYLQADAVETSLTVTVTLGSFTITSGAVKVVVAK